MRLQSLPIPTHHSAHRAESALLPCTDAGSLGLAPLKNKRVSKDLSKEELSWPLTLMEPQEVSADWRSARDCEALKRKSHKFSRGDNSAFPQCHVQGLLTHRALL